MLGCDAAHGLPAVRVQGLIGEMPVSATVVYSPVFTVSLIYWLETCSQERETAWCCTAECHAQVQLQMFFRVTACHLDFTSCSHPRIRVQGSCNDRVIPNLRASIGQMFLVQLDELQLCSSPHDLICSGLVDRYAWRVKFEAIIR
jgi:hypothetical protein